MSKQIRIAVLLITIGIGAFSRLSIAGWLFIIGVLSIIILCLIHIIVHCALIKYDANPTRTDWILTGFSHLFFIFIFLFQSDGGDDRGFVVIEYLLEGKGSRYWQQYATTILTISLVGYFLVTAILLTRLKTRNISFTGKKLRIILAIILLVILIPVGGLFLISGIDNRREMKRNEEEGKYEDLDRALRNKEKVRVLRLYEYPNAYKAIPAGVFELTGLDELEMYSNEITEIPKGIASLKNLKRLDLQYNHIKSIPEEIGQMDSLEALVLINNNIDSISPAICNCSSLRYLSVGGQSLQSIPPCLAQMNTLEELIIQSDSINNFMESFSGLKQLKRLTLYTYGNSVRDNKKYFALSRMLPNAELDIPRFIVDSLKAESK